MFVFCLTSSCFVAVAVDFVLKQLINYLNNYLCSCCGGVVLVTSAVFVLMVVLVVVDEVGVVDEIIFIFGVSNCSKKKEGEVSKSDFKTSIFRHTDVSNRMFKFEG